MTPQELSSINCRVYQYFQTRNKSRLLIHALDKSLLTDAEFHQINICKLSESTLFDAPWAMALFWGRLFYEKSDGNNYRRIIQDALRIKRPDTLFDRINDTCKWFPVDNELLNRKTYRFQSEFWLTGNAGDTSNLWKSLRRFVRRAVPGATDQQICDLNSSDEEDITPPIRWLLQNQDQDFCNSLRWLHSGANGQPVHGSGAAGVIAVNSIYPELQKNDDFSASFGIRKYGNRAELVLRIRNISFGSHNASNTRQLSIKQNDQIVFQGSISRQTPSIALAERDFYQATDFSKPIQICLGNMVLDSSDVTPVPWSDSKLLLFRQSDEGNVSRFVFKDPKNDRKVPHVQGRYFYVLGRPGEIAPPDLELGGVRQNLNSQGAVSHAGSDRILFRLDVGGLHQQVEPLSEPGQEPLAKIGRKPFLSINLPLSGWRLPGGDDTPVIVGCPDVTISAENFIGSQIVMSIQDSLGNDQELIPHPNNPLCFDLTIGQAHWGRKWTFKATSQLDGDVISEYLFLPDLSLMGVYWTQSNIPADRRFDDARLGLEDGVLSYPGGATQILRPIHEPTWAWSQPMGTPQDFNVNRQFVDHQDITSWRIDYVLPPGGRWELRFNNDVVSRESGRVSLADVVANHIPLGQMGANLGVMDVIQIVNAANGDFVVPAIAQIDRNPVHPVVGIVQGVPSIYIPATFQQSGWRLFLLRESDLLNNSLQEIHLVGYPPGNIHRINNLPVRHQNEGAWLVLIDFGIFGAIEIPGLLEFAGMLSLPQVSLSSICEISHQGVGQTFPLLLDNWKQHALDAQDHEQVRSTLDLLDHSLGQQKMPRGQGEIFGRARTDRHLLGFGSRNLLINYFDSEFLRAVDSGQGALESLLLLLLECGFNWLAHPLWSESLTEKMRNRLGYLNRRFTPTIKRVLKEVVPLIESFESIQEGNCEGIKRIAGEFLKPPVNQGEIGLSVACPSSEDPGFRNGIPYRGVGRQGINLSGFQNRPRQVYWPDNYRQAVKIMDTRGRDHPIILKVTDSWKAAAFMEDEREDRIVAASNLQEPIGHKIRIRKLFHRALRSAAPLIGNPRNREPGKTQLGLLFRACNIHFMKAAREEGGHGFRSVIYQVAVMSRLHAWLTDSRSSPPGWPLNDPASYDLVSRVVATIWKSSEHRKALEKDVAPIEWLITWFKNPNFHP
jgi:hypothetical protein